MIVRWGIKYGGQWMGCPHNDAKGVFRLLGPVDKSHRSLFNHKSVATALLKAFRKQCPNVEFKLAKLTYRTKHTITQAEWDAVLKSASQLYYDTIVKLNSEDHAWHAYCNK